MRQLTLAEAYLNENGGSPTEYQLNLSNGQRLGEAFFNALSGTDQELLQGRSVDPFWRYTTNAVEAAIEFLLYSKQ